MFNSSTSKNENDRNLLHEKREEFRSEIRKQSQQQYFSAKRKQFIQADQVASDRNILVQLSKGTNSKETLNTIFGMTQSEEDCQFLFKEGFLIQACSILEKSTNQEEFELIYGTLTNLANYDDFKNQDQSLILQTLDRATFLLKQPQYSKKLIEYILIYTSNLCDGNEKLCSLYMQQGFLSILDNLLKRVDPPLTNIYFIIYTLFKNVQSANEQYILDALKLISFTIKKCPIIEDEEIQFDIVNSLSYIVQPTETIVRAMFQLDLIKFLVDSLKTETMPEALKVLKQISTIEGLFGIEIVQLFIDLGILNYLNDILANRSNQTRKNCFLLLGNICCSNQQIVQSIVQHPIINRLFNSLIHERVEEQSYGIFCFLQMISVANDLQYEKLISMGFLKNLRKLIEQDDAMLLLRTITCITFMCNYGREQMEKRNININPTVVELKTLNINPYLERLQRHKSLQVYEKTVELLVTFFDYSPKP